MTQPPDQGWSTEAIVFIAVCCFFLGFAVCGLLSALHVLTWRVA
jgi:hypothetical protein